MADNFSKQLKQQSGGSTKTASTQSDRSSTKKKPNTGDLNTAKKRQVNVTSFKDVHVAGSQLFHEMAEATEKFTESIVEHYQHSYVESRNTTDGDKRKKEIQLRISSKFNAERMFIKQIQRLLRTPDSLFAKVERNLQPSSIVEADKAQELHKVASAVAEKSRQFRSLKVDTEQQVKKIDEYIKFVANLQARTDLQERDKLGGLAKLSECGEQARERHEKIQNMGSAIENHLKELIRVINEVATTDQEVVKVLNDARTKLAQLGTDVNKSRDKAKTEAKKIEEFFSTEAIQGPLSDDYLHQAKLSLEEAKKAEEELTPKLKEIADCTADVAKNLRKNGDRIDEANGIFIEKAIESVRKSQKDRTAGILQETKDSWEPTGFIKHRTGHSSVRGIWRRYFREFWLFKPYKEKLSSTEESSPRKLDFQAWKAFCRRLIVEQNTGERKSQPVYRPDIGSITIDGKSIDTTTKRIYDLHQWTPHAEAHISIPEDQFEDGARDKGTLTVIDHFDNKSSTKTFGQRINGEGDTPPDENNQSNGSSYWENYVPSIPYLTSTKENSKKDSIPAKPAEPEKIKTCEPIIVSKGAITVTSQDQVDESTKKLVSRTRVRRDTHTGIVQQEERTEFDHNGKKVRTTNIHYDKHGQETGTEIKEYDDREQVKLRKRVIPLDMKRIASLDINLKKELGDTETLINLQTKTHTDDPITSADADVRSKRYNVEEMERQFRLNALVGVGGKSYTPNLLNFDLVTQDLTESGVEPNPDLGLVHRNAGDNNDEFSMRVLGTFDVNDLNRMPAKKQLLEMAKFCAQKKDDYLIAALETRDRDIYIPALALAKLVNAKQESFTKAYLGERFNQAPANDEDLKTLADTWVSDDPFVTKMDQHREPLNTIQKAVQDLGGMYQKKATEMFNADNVDGARKNLHREINAAEHNKERGNPNRGKALLWDVLDDAADIALLFGQDPEQARQNKIKEIKEIKSFSQGEKVINHAIVDQVHARMMVAINALVSIGAFDDAYHEDAKNAFVNGERDAKAKTIEKSIIGHLRRNLQEGKREEFDTIVQSIQSKYASEENIVERSAKIVSDLATKATQLGGKIRGDAPASFASAVREMSKEANNQAEEKWNLKGNWYEKHAGDHFAKYVFGFQKGKLDTLVKDAQEWLKTEKQIAPEIGGNIVRLQFVKRLEAMAEATYAAYEGKEGDINAKKEAAKETWKQMEEKITNIDRTLNSAAEKCEKSATDIIQQVTDDTIKAEQARIQKKIKEIDDFNIITDLATAQEFVNESLFPLIKDLNGFARIEAEDYLLQCQKGCKTLFETLNNGEISREKITAIKNATKDTFIKIYAAKIAQSIAHSFEDATDDKIIQASIIKRNELITHIFQKDVLKDMDIKDAIEGLQIIKANADSALDCAKAIYGGPSQYSKAFEKSLEELEEFVNNGPHKDKEETFCTANLKDRLAEAKLARFTSFTEEAQQPSLDLFKGYCDYIRNPTDKNRFLAQNILDDFKAEDSSPWKTQIIIKEMIRGILSDDLQEQKRALDHLGDLVPVARPMDPQADLDSARQFVEHLSVEFLRGLAGKSPTDVLPVLQEMDYMMQHHYDEVVERVRIGTDETNVEVAKEVVNKIKLLEDLSPNIEGDKPELPSLDFTTLKDRVKKLEKQLAKIQNQMKIMGSSEDPGEVAAYLIPASREMAAVQVEFEIAMETDPKRKLELKNDKDKKIDILAEKIREDFNKERERAHEYRMKLKDEDMLHHTTTEQMKLFELTCKMAEQLEWTRLWMNLFANGSSDLVKGLGGWLDKFMTRLANMGVQAAKR